MRINGQRWANGVSVGVYPAAAWPDPSHAPFGAAVELATVANGAVTFDETNLTVGQRYVAYAAGLGIGFLVPDHSPTDSDRSRIAELEAAIVALQGALGSGEESLLPDLFTAGSLSGQGNNPYWMYIRASDNTLFVTFTNDLFVKSYDISGIFPVYLGVVSIGGSIAGITGQGNYLYVTDSLGLLLKVVNATNPAAMSVVGSVAYTTGGPGGGRLGVSPDGTKVMIGGPESGVNDNRSVLVNVATPTAPAVLGSIVSGGTIRGVCAIDNTHWALASRDDHTARIIDCTVPGTPVEVFSIPLVGDITTSMNMDGTTLYVGGFGSVVGYLEAWDVAIPTAPAFLSSCIVPAGPEQTALDTVNHRAYIGCRTSSTMAAVDISDPANLTLIDSIAVNGTITPGVAIHPNGAYAYLTCAGDTANGKLFVILVQPTVSLLVEAVQAQVTSLDTATPKLSAANTLTQRQTFSASPGIVLDNAVPAIRFGPTDLLQHLSAGTLRSDTVMTLLGLVLFNTGAMLRSKVLEADVEFAFTINGNGDMRWGDRTNTQDARINRPAAHQLQAEDCDWLVGSAGRGLRIKESGSVGKQGISQLVAGTVVVPNTTVTANSRIYLTNNVPGGAPGWLQVSARTPGTSFTILSSSGTDTSFVAWLIVEPA